MTATPAEIRLAQYGERTSTWSTATYNDGTEKALHEIALGLKAEVDRLRDALAKEERLHGETIDDRDRMHEVADKLAYAVAPIEVIGEHSSMNDPWENALDHLTPAAEVAKLRQELASARAAALREAADIAESLRQFEPAFGARKSAQISENVGILRVADELRRRADPAGATTSRPEPRIPDHVVNEEQGVDDEETFCSWGEGDAPGSGCILRAGHEPANRHLYTPGDVDEVEA